MTDKSNKKYDQVFFITIWGENYINDFNNYTCACLIENLRNIKNNYNILYIFTQKKDLGLLKKKVNVKKLEKIIKIKYLLFDSIKKHFYFQNNKYFFLSLIQLLFSSAINSKCNYIWYLYPDFIFSENSIKNIIKKISIKKTAYLLPIPQIEKESADEILKHNGIKYICENLVDIIINHLHNIVKYFDVRNIQLNSPSVLCLHEKNYLIMNNFHWHPLVIPADQTNNAQLQSFFPSLDEGFKANKNKIYIPYSSKEVIFASILSKSDYSNYRKKFSLNDSLCWLEAHTTEFQRTINHIFAFYKKKPKIFDIQLLKNFKKNLINNLSYTNEKLFEEKKYNQIAARMHGLKYNTNKLIDLNNQLQSDLYKNKFFKTFKKNEKQIFKEFVTKNKNNKFINIIIDLYFSL